MCRLRVRVLSRCLPWDLCSPKPGQVYPTSPAQPVRRSSPTTPATAHTHSISHLESCPANRYSPSGPCQTLVTSGGLPSPTPPGWIIVPALPGEDSLPAGVLISDTLPWRVGLRLRFLEIPVCSLAPSVSSVSVVGLKDSLGRSVPPGPMRCGT